MKLYIQQANFFFTFTICQFSAVSAETVTTCENDSVQVLQCGETDMTGNNLFDLILTVIGEIKLSLTDLLCAALVALIC